MSKILFIDCFSGISGDMMLGALIGLGLEKTYLQQELEKTGLKGYSLEVKDKNLNGIIVKDIDIILKGKQVLRDYSEIKKIISESSLGEKVKSIALKIFDELALAEAKVHGVDKSSVHFHEIGAVDSIVDIISTAIGLVSLGIEKVISSPVPLGKGQTDSMHGKIPVPAPATIELLKGLPVYGGGFDFEVTTPTGAAIIKALAEEFTDFPEMIPEAVGLGSGKRKNKGLPNMLRLIMGSSTGQDKGLIRKTLYKISTNIDDMNPEIVATLFEKLELSGALDVWIENIYMKKNRPAIKLNVLSESKDLEIISKEIFKNTTTFGLRIEKTERIELERKSKKVKLPYGDANIKLGYYKGEIVTKSPEFKDCLKLQKKTGKPLKEIYLDVVFFFQGNST